MGVRVGSGKAGDKDWDGRSQGDAVGEMSRMQHAVWVTTLLKSPRARYTDTPSRTGRTFLELSEMPGLS